MRLVLVATSCLIVQGCQHHTFCETGYECEPLTVGNNQVDYVSGIDLNGNSVKIPTSSNSALHPYFAPEPFAPAPSLPSFSNLPSFGVGLAVGGAYEGKIDGEFTGWAGHTVYSLLDGHIIRQTQYYYHYYYAYSPTVIIYRTGFGELQARVMGDDDQAVAVEFLR